MGVRPKDIFWLAGLLEGEGWFGKTVTGTPIIALSMTDRDVVERVSRLLDTCSVKNYRVVKVGRGSAVKIVDLPLRVKARHTLPNKVAFEMAGAQQSLRSNPTKEIVPCL